MGGDADPSSVKELAGWVKSAWNGLKTCWYSGRDLAAAREVLPALDYVKVGPYREEFGPLDSPTTNQRFYKVFDNGARLEECTELFRRKIF